MNNDDRAKFEALTDDDIAALRSLQNEYDSLLQRWHEACAGSQEVADLDATFKARERSLGKLAEQGLFKRVLSALASAQAASAEPVARMPPLLNANDLSTNFCAKWSGAQKVEAGDILDWIMQQPLYATPAPAVAPAAVTDETAWQQAERMTDVPAVEDALRTFLADQTGDNATGVVCAVLTAACRQPCNAAGCLARTPEPQAEREVQFNGVDDTLEQIRAKQSSFALTQERATWLADKICNGGDYAKEAAWMLSRWPGEPQPDSRGQAREGWRWVPVEATQAMRDAGYGPITAYGSTAYVSAAAVWRSMIAASPTPDEQRAQAAREEATVDRLMGIADKAIAATDEEEAITRRGDLHDAIRTALAGRQQL